MRYLDGNDLRGLRDRTECLVGGEIVGMEEKEGGVGSVAALAIRDAPLLYPITTIPRPD